MLAPLRALWNAEPRLGCTVHRIDQRDRHGIDTGLVYSISHLTATPGRAVQSYIPDLYRLGIDSLLELVKSIESGHCPELTPQDSAAFRYFRPPTAEEYRAKNIPLYDLSDYSKLLQQFLPTDAATESRLGADRTYLESLLSQHLKQSTAPL